MLNYTVCIQQLLENTLNFIYCNIGGGSMGGWVGRGLLFGIILSR